MMMSFKWTSRWTKLIHSEKSHSKEMIWCVVSLSLFFSFLVESFFRATCFWWSIHIIVGINRDYFSLRSTITLYKFYQVIFPFSYWSTFGLVFVFGFYEESCNEQSCPSVLVNTWFLFLLSKYLEMKWLRHGCMFSFTKNKLSGLFPKWLHHFIFPPKINKSLVLTFKRIWLSILAVVQISHHSFNFHFS
jgi:hypothetical protein